MSIRARILNYALKKYVKKVQPAVKDRSYLEARKMMNQKGYEDTNSSIVNTSLQKFISVSYTHLTLPTNREV